MRGIRRYRAEGESGEILAEGRKESVNQFHCGSWGFQVVLGISADKNELEWDWLGWGLKGSIGRGETGSTVRFSRVSRK